MDPVIGDPVCVIDTLEYPLIDPSAEAVINPVGLPVTVNVPKRVTVPVIVPSFELLYVRSGDSLIVIVAVGDTVIVATGVGVQEGVTDAIVGVGRMDTLDVSDPVDVIDAVVADTVGVCDVVDVNNPLAVFDTLEESDFTLGVTDAVIADPLCEADAV